jgi:hypothetical protein
MIDKSAGFIGGGRVANIIVMNLIPVKPFTEEESIIKGFYQNRLTTLYKKLKS